MELGVTMFVTDQTMGITEVARAVEERGFSSLFLPEHTHIPVSRKTPAPTGQPELPGFYSRTVDQFVALGAAAAVTSRLRLGTGITLVAQHDPIVLAKSVSTLDMISGGRVVLGIGFGWNREELADHGVEFASRREVVRERVALMQRLWADDVASMTGSFVDVEPSWQWPKPVQRPRVKTLIGGAAGPKLFTHVADYADGWIPIGGRGVSKALPELQAAWSEAGRDGAPVIVPFATLPDQGKLDYYASLGIEEVVLQLPSAGAERVLRTLDEYAGFLA